MTPPMLQTCFVNLNFSVSVVVTIFRLKVYVSQGFISQPSIDVESRLLERCRSFVNYQCHGPLFLIMAIVSYTSNIAQIDIGSFFGLQTMGLSGYHAVLLLAISTIWLRRSQFLCKSARFLLCREELANYC